jgi:hypothetical protein
VATITLNHEQPHEEARGRHCKQQGDPPIFKMNRSQASGQSAASGAAVIAISTMLRTEAEVETVFNIIQTVLF